MKKMMTIVFGCIVGIFLIVGVGIPVIHGIGGDISITVDNDPVSYTMMESTENGTYEITWNNTNSEISINGTPIDIMRYPAVVMTNNLVMVTTSSGTPTIYDFENNMRTEATSNAPMTLIMSEGVVSYVKGEQTYTSAYDFAWIAAPDDGEWSVINLSSDTFHVTKDTAFYLFTSSYYINSETGYSPYSLIEYTSATDYQIVVQPQIIGSEVTDPNLVWNNGIISENEKNNEYQNSAVLNYTTTSGTLSKGMSALVPTEYKTTNTMTETVEKIVSIVPIILILILLVMAAYVVMDYVKSPKIN